MRTIITDGSKSVEMGSGINDSWDFVEAFSAGNMGPTELYARVAAAFQAVNKSARAVANMPFALVTKGGEDYDTSDAWENKVKFMPQPKDLLRRVRQSLIMSNKAYLRMGKNIVGIPKSLHYVVPPSIEIVTDPKTGDLVSLDRRVNGALVKRYFPDDPDLIRFWWLDEKTELLPSPDTEFKAMLSATGVIYYSDYFTESFYRRGGIKPTLIAMKGLIAGDKKDEAEKGWAKFLRGVGKWWNNNVRIFNAETMDVKAFGDGLGDLKETPVYRQALENIAIALDMPLSLLLSNSANYATAQIEYYQWYRNSVTPWCEFIGDVLNEQLFDDMGLRLEFRPEVTDPEKQDEVAHNQAFLGFGDSFTKYPTYDLWINSATGVFGFEIPDDLMSAAQSYYSDKEKQAAEIQAQTQQAQQQPKQEPPKPNEQATQAEQPPADVPVKWIPSLDELEELRVWREVALRRFKKSESLDFDYQPHHGGLPEDVTKSIKQKLLDLYESDEYTEGRIDADEIKAAFVFDNAKQETKSEIELLAEAMNRLADAQKAQ